MKRLLLLSLLVFAVAAAPRQIRHLQLTMADRESDFPDLVWTGSRLGVAWMDGRDGNQEIYFRTADMNTKTLGPERRITYSETWDDNPRLAWTGNGFGLVWIHELRTQFQLKFLLLSPEGAAQGKARTLAGPAFLGKETAITWTGSGYGVVYTQFRGGVEQGDLVYLFLDEKGNPLGKPVTVASEPGVKVPSKLLKVGSTFFLFYLNATTDTARALPLDPFGNLKGQPITLNPSGTRAGTPSAAFNGKMLIAAWPQRKGEVVDIMAQALSPGGARVGEPYTLTTPGPNRPSVAVAAGPDGFGLAWLEMSNEGRTLFFRALDPLGKPAEEPIRLSKPRPVKIMTNRITLAADNAGYAIAWVDVAPPINTEVILSRVGFRSPEPTPPPAPPRTPEPAPSPGTEGPSPPNAAPSP